MDIMQNAQYDPYSQNSFQEKQDKNGVYLKDKVQVFKEKFNYVAIRVFPYIGRFITFLFFYTKRIISSGIKIAVDQLKF